ERVDDAAEARAELTADLGQDLERTLVALVREADEPMRVRCRAEGLAGQLVRRLPRDVGLEVSAAAADARQAVVYEHRVAELRAGADRAAVRPSAENQAAADAGAERDHDHVACALTGAGAPLGDGGGVAVVVERDRQAEPLPHHVA